MRQYKDEDIPDREIEFMIDCARYAPSDFNMQPWSFLVIKNRETLRKLSDAGKKSMIPLLIIILGNKAVMTYDLDCAMVAQNMMLAAHSKGIGSCWIGGLLPALMDEGLLKGHGTPEGYMAAAPVIFGYPEGKTEMHERSDPVVRWIQ